MVAIYFVGVNDDGEICGLEPLAINSLITDLVNLTNNQEKLDPPFILHPKVYELENKLIIHIQVLASSQVHKTGKICIRS